MASSASTGQLIKLIEEFQAKNTILSSRTNGLGTEKDSQEFRIKLGELREQMKNLAKKITTMIKEKSVSEDKRVIAKLKQQFETELNNFKNTTLFIENKEKQILVSLSLPDDSPLSRADGIQLPGNKQVQTMAGPSHSEVQDHVIAIQEKQEAIHQIERDVVLLNDMFKDLNYLVVEQQVGIDLIENNVQKTKNTTESAHKELVEASEYQSSSRKWLCWMLIIVLIVVGVVVGVLVGVLKK